MAYKSLEKTVRAFIIDIRLKNKGNSFHDEDDALPLCKLLFYGWLKPNMHGPDGLYALFLKTKHMGDPEHRAFVIAERISKPWTFDQFRKIFFEILDKASRRTLGNDIARMLVDSEIPDLIYQLNKKISEQGLIWYTPYLVEALVQMEKEHLTFKAECDRADEATERAEQMIALAETK